MYWGVFICSTTPTLSVFYFYVVMFGCFCTGTFVQSVSVCSPRAVIAGRVWGRDCDNTATTRTFGILKHTDPFVLQRQCATSTVLMLVFASVCYIFAGLNVSPSLCFCSCVLSCLWSMRCVHAKSGSAASFQRVAQVILLVRFYFKNVKLSKTTVSFL